MLVICNGNLKSGSTWVLGLVRALGTWKPVPEKWRDSRWKNPSISPQQFDAYFRSQEWLHHHYYCKQHWRGSDKYLRLHEKKGVKVLNSVRDIRDVLVSRYFHDLNAGVFVGDSIERYYFDGPGREAICEFIYYHNFWAAAPAESHYVVRYESLIDDFDSEASRLFAHLGVVLTPAQLDKLKQATDFASLHQKSESFFRKGTVGDWTNHLGDAVVKDLMALCTELGFTYRLGPNSEA